MDFADRGREKTIQNILRTSYMEAPCTPAVGEMAEGNGGDLVRACGVRESKPTLSHDCRVSVGLWWSIPLTTHEDSLSFPICNFPDCVTKIRNGKKYYAISGKMDEGEKAPIPQYLS